MGEAGAAGAVFVLMPFPSSMATGYRSEPGPDNRNPPPGAKILLAWSEGRLYSGKGPDEPEGGPIVLRLRINPLANDEGALAIRREGCGIEGVETIEIVNRKRFFRGWLRGCEASENEQAEEDGRTHERLPGNAAG